MSDKESGNGHQPETPDVSHIRNVEVTHELSDINIGGVLTFVVALVIMTVAVYIGMWLLFDYFQDQQAKEPQPGPMAFKKEERLPPEPRLQSAPGFALTLEDGSKVVLEKEKPQAEYRVLREQWVKELRGEIKDASGNPISIPIDEAIEKVVSGEGLPARTKDAPSKLADYAISAPTAASSGRVSDKRLQ
jgi:hypothetical protein